MAYQGFSKSDLAIRGTGVGSSEIAAIIGISPWADKHTVWRRLMGEPGQDMTSAMFYGLCMENGLLEFYSTVTQQKIRDSEYPAFGTGGPVSTSAILTTKKPDIKRHDKYPHVVDSIDGLAFVDGELHHGIEIKTTNWRNQDGWGEEWTDQVPFYYLTQCQFHCAVWKLPYCDVIVDWGDGPKFYRVPYDHELFENLAERVERFWRDYVATRREPPITSCRASEDWLKSKFPRSSDVLIPADDETSTLMEKWYQARADEKKAKTDKDNAAIQLKLAIGENQGLVHEGTGSYMTWKSTKDGSKVKWEELAKELLGGRSDAIEQIEKHRHVVPGYRRIHGVQKARK